MIVVGLDISKANCGVAIGDGSAPPRTRCESFPGSLDAAFGAFGLFVREILVGERPALVVAEAPFTGRNPKVDEVLYGLHGIARERCHNRRVPYTLVSIRSWRSAFLGKKLAALKRDAAKAAALAECARLRWPTLGSDDVAEACGVWCWAHIHHGNKRGMDRMLSASSIRAFGG